MNKIIVTGGLGFIGSNLVELLLKKNFYVINIDKKTYSSNLYNIREFKNSKKYKFIKLDIANKKIKKVLTKYRPSGVFNLAAETHVDRSIDNPGTFVQSNILGVYNLLECFKNFSNQNKSKLIHISTDEASKAASDHLVSSYIKTYNLPAIVTNCSNNYGPKQHPEKLIPKLIYNIINNRSLPIYGKGINSREWIYVKDHCEALIKVFFKGKIGEFYNIGSNKNLNNLQVAKEILKSSAGVIKLGKKVKINFVKDRPGHDIRYALNSNKIKRELKWFPKTEFSKGIKLTLKWYLKNKSYFNSFSKKDIINRLGKK